MSSKYLIIRILLEALLPFIICFLFLSKSGYANNEQSQQSHIVSVSSLIPPTECNRKPLPQGSGKAATLEVVSKYSPCSTLNQGKKTNIPSFQEILRRDSLRISLKSSRLSRMKKSFTFPTNIDNLNGGEYYLIAAIGEPKQTVSLILDTGSSTTWTQSQPCGKNCFKQRDPIFDPSKSKTFAQLLCDTQLCKFFLQEGHCTSKNGGCPYQVAYVDGSSQTGFFGVDRLTIQTAQKGVFYYENYPFGCVTSSKGNLDGLSGIMGLDRNPLSFVSLTNTTHFSYCLPSTYGSTGYITFGKTGDDGDLKNKFIKYTPIRATPPQVSDSYNIALTGVSVGGKNLQIRSSVYSKLDSSIDSGASITCFPASIYAAFRTAFRKKMLKYKLVEKPNNVSDPDTCYDLSDHESVVIPKVTMQFLGGVDLDLDVRGILYFNNRSEVCLAFTACPSQSNNLFLFGNVQQRGFQVVYDVSGRRVGFGPGSCT